MHLSYEVPSTDFSVCVTKPGNIPIVYYVLHNGFIQNEILTENTICTANNVLIGSDVTNLTSQGPVVISKGHTSVIAPKGAIVKNHFEVKKGATLNICPTMDE